MVPEGPNFLKMHLVTRGNTLDIGSILSWSYKQTRDQRSRSHSRSNSKISYVIGLEKRSGLDPVVVELPAEEAVREEHVPDHVDQVEDLREEHLERPVLVRVTGLREVGGQFLLPASAFLVVHDPGLEALDDELERGIEMVTDSQNIL